MEPKVFNDPVHGHMEFHPFLVKIIDTPQFQRLRNLKQLGGAYFIYPGASHNRFEHSLGVAHLAGELVRNLKEKQAELGIDDRDVLCVEIAGLCHDLGHGPFSHMFDGMFIPKRRPDKKWKHEKGSVQMFEYIVRKLKKGGFDLLSELENLNEKNEGQDLDFIKEMIIGPNEEGQYKGRPSNKSFLYEIVSNKRNGLDVDKFDYFARDCYNLGIKNSFDHHRFIKFARVCEVDGRRQICTRDKEQPNIYEMFHTRSSLHRKAYQHKTNKIIELMITEAFIKADPKLKMSEAIDDMEAYTILTDCVFEEILYSEDNDLKEAREILEDVVSRKLHQYLGKTKMKEMPEVTEDLKEKWKVELAKTSVTTYQDEPKLTKDDFEIIISSFDFGMKEKNPIDNLHFYSKSDNAKAFKMSSEQVSQFLWPAKFSEKWINVYCKSTDKNTVAYRHFYQWCHDKDFLLPRSPFQSMAANPQPKVFNDPIHGHMEFQPILVKIIDTPEFQRLRFIKQLGGAYFVYPGASHNRFEHSLGVAHLAGLLVRSLQKKHPKLIDEKDILCVEIAGLCHDLGCGPFYGEFDDIFNFKKKSTASANLFKQIEKRLDLGLSDKDKTFIEEIIKGVDAKEEPNSLPKNKYFLYDIVNNRRSGMDVTVFDYVARDCYHLGLKTNFDHQRLIKFARVERNQICFRDKVMSTMYDLFRTIAALKSKAYQHKVTLAIQAMMSDAVKEQMCSMKEENKSEEEIYSLLTDSLFGGRSKPTKKAKDIVKNIHSRSLYKYVTKVMSQGAEIDQETCTAQLIKELRVQREDIGIYVSHKQDGADPIHRTHFYDKTKKILTNEQIDEKRLEMSKLENTERQWIYIFCKNPEIDLKEAKKIVEAQMPVPAPQTPELQNAGSTN